MLKNVVKQLLAAATQASEKRHHPAGGRIEELLQNGISAQSQGRLHDAEAYYRGVLSTEPGHGGALHLLGHVLTLQGRLQEAAETLRSGIQVAPNAEIWYSLASTLRAQRRFDEAAQAFGAAISLRPGFAAGWVGRGDALATLDRLDEAEHAYREAIACEPAFAEAHHNYGNLLHREGRIAECLAAYRRAVELKPDFVRAHSNLVYALNFSSDYAAEQIYAAHLQWASRHETPLAAEIQPPAATLDDPERRLRVGYVSPNFRDHAVALFFEPALKNHDRERFSIYLYSDVANPDARTARLRGYGDEWRDIAGRDDAAVADLVRGDRIDLLVDLTGHTDGHRLLVFARKPAPLQVTWNGYANTTGMQAMDYRITDAYADPPGMTERWHSERLLRMPEIYMAFGPPERSPDVNAPPSQAKGYVTFGSFNALAKITSGVVEVWSRILRNVADARLLMLTVPEGRTRRNILRAFAEQGISAERLKLLGRLPFDAFLAAHHEADIALDPFPFAGTTTTCQSLWMGVPVVTLAGKTHAARVGVTVLSNLGLDRLIARDVAEYEAIATRLASTPADLASLRAGLRDRMLRSPNLDGARHTRFLEAAYRRIWRDWCKATVR